jgi:DNA-binding LytR/AlgR family response regulator
MKIYRVLVVEDNSDDQKHILSLVNQVPFLTVVGIFDDALSALPFLTTEPVDLLLLDLHLPGLSGFGLLRSLPNPPAVILTTSSLADSLEAFDVGVVDYLLKPIRYERFLRAINRIMARQVAPVAPSPVYSPAAIILKKGYESIRVVLEEITCIEAFGSYSKVYFREDKELVVSHLLVDLLERLPENQFLRVHRSFIVSVAYVLSFNARQITLAERKIPVSRAYYDQLEVGMNQKSRDV